MCLKRAAVLWCVRNKRMRGLAVSEILGFPAKPSPAKLSDICILYLHGRAGLFLVSVRCTRSKSNIHLCLLYFY